jgi:hypothetical protein
MSRLSTARFHHPHGVNIAVGDGAGLGNWPLLGWFGLIAGLLLWGMKRSSGLAFTQSPAGSPRSEEPRSKPIGG